MNIKIFPNPRNFTSLKKNSFKNIGNSIKDIKPEDYPKLSKMFENLFYYSHKMIYKIAFLNKEVRRVTKIPLAARKQEKKLVMGNLVEVRNKKCNELYSFKIRHGKKTLAENYFSLEPRTTEYIDDTNIGITFPPHIHVYFTDGLMGRKQYKNLFNILNQAVFEKGIQSGYFPKITFAPVKMGSSKQRSLGMDTYQKFIGADNGTFTREKLLDYLVSMVNKQNFLFEDTPQNILSLLKNEKINLPEIETKITNIIKDRSL